MGTEIEISDDDDDGMKVMIFVDSAGGVCI